MMFHFGWISKRANILMEMLRYFISGSVYMIFYHPKWKFFFCQNDCNEITPTMSFKRTRALNAISNKPPLVHYVLGNFLTWISHAGLKFYSGQSDRYEVRTGLSSFRLSCERQNIYCRSFFDTRFLLTHFKPFIRKRPAVWNEFDVSTNIRIPEKGINLCNNFFQMR